MRSIDEDEDEGRVNLDVGAAAKTRKGSGVHERRLLHAEKDYDVVRISKASAVK